MKWEVRRVDVVCGGCGREMEESVKERVYEGVKKVMCKVDRTVAFGSSVMVVVKGKDGRMKGKRK